ncbi:MAG: chromosomal replication initiator protein DnaA [Planctomycetota bacterium]
MTQRRDPLPDRNDSLLAAVLLELGKNGDRVGANVVGDNPWLRDLRIASASPASCVFVVPTAFVRDWLRRKHLAALAGAVRRQPGYEHCNVTLESENSLPKPARDRLAPSLDRYRTRGRSRAEERAQSAPLAQAAENESARVLRASGTDGPLSATPILIPADSPSAGPVAAGPFTSAAAEPGFGRRSDGPATAPGRVGWSVNQPSSAVTPQMNRSNDAPPPTDDSGSPEPTREPNAREQKNGASPQSDGNPRGLDSRSSASREPSDSGAARSDDSRSDGEKESPNGSASEPAVSRASSDPIRPEPAGFTPRRIQPARASCELSRNYTFDQFVVGPCNRLSHAAALAVSDNPGRAYNPLFVHGSVGLGKTHVLQAICHEIRRKDDNARVLYLSCEEFTNRFINSIQAGRLEEFRELHREADVLVIDDVQFLADKGKTQEEFFHTFNALYHAQRQIVLSSDRPPSEIPTIEDRLVSRFKWGLVVEMAMPCLETRTAIVRRKARARQVELADDVAFHIAKRIDTNIRELEGAITKVLGVAEITEREITVDLVDEALRGVISRRQRPVSLTDVVELVTNEFSLSARELTGKGRAQTVSLPRQVCMFIARQLTDLSYDEIGRSFSGRDHTTVLYAVRKVEKRIKDDRVFREMVTSLITRLRG